ncbi:UNVERIFIED_CONTAM: hypothetical protein GTU68_026301 [Idotea baltica]|nr:hypothetical protein [Idotea baltica]
MAGRLPNTVDLKEMLNSGMIGLVDAMGKFDTSHDTNFTTYAQFRIRGAILDSFRAQDWLPRSLRQKSHRVQQAYQIVEQKLGRPATDSEVAKELSLDLKEFRKILGQISNLVMLSFEEFGFGYGEERFKGGEWLKTEDKSPLDKLMGTEKVKIIARSLDRLPDKERLVISLYFYEELNLKEIGEIMEITESRASQIRSRALIRLKNYLRHSFS